MKATFNYKLIYGFVRRFVTTLHPFEKINKKKMILHFLEFLLGPPSNVFFSTSAYFVNDLTDNKFYPSA